MKVAMVKHTSCGQVFWFETPEHLVGKLHPDLMWPAIRHAGVGMVLL